MLPREVLRQVRRLQLRARRAVEDPLGGEYRSVFKGAGIAFEEVREYQPGDDVRTIDWNVTARMGHPFIKRFVEEIRRQKREGARQRPSVSLIDRSSIMTKAASSVTAAMARSPRAVLRMRRLGLIRGWPLLRMRDAG